MIAIPAIDLREGACVQLVGGSYEAERVRVDPLDALKQWLALGFRTFHVVDLDAALGKGSNADVVARLVSHAPGLTFTVGGGVRDASRVEAVLAGGASSVVVGTRAIEDLAWLTEVAERFPGRVVVAADVKGREVVTRGWTAGSARDIRDVLSALEPLPLGGMLVTAVHKEGQLGGVDLPLMEEVARSSRHRLYASGGVTTLEDLRALAKVGAHGAVVGMALYTGRLDARAVAREFTE
ncbi:1-(5-phosphoribosyl)-5-[(5-phosphoribosylamino)methylideneamino] imidazole-4-carboxamide isomerase [Corallococcus exercitus]|uniref:1-(5-phosphoribosyl)-5-[(5-phosphoribosylamino)methylideneamino] imidazole-4-carboxamide isomerase n=1 Tax=Corallococcus exercitus TaxID=2316736 RepID=A0A3A8IGL8_9BACT|nr:1-(5-phosphoribosyl)-5-[(5-phosphoribosylamino)methylideneamino] imidazole-4-carboxamide isomerase [Corallococcus exercitus]NOK36844.1 1-(5-phosphoribosyl)-5-[(5-phosphoribosylamino)methylideneamino] imidazole-4-carboxamide isomerase [Corallococcus exercitus]RKG82542.1 1-(5-phosphoribosyl)-5-[(5-phosphoribosylamino)methylideneamino] imidazole-4-carboxamide isomerase [Corallococcus exercitus]